MISAIKSIGERISSAGVISDDVYSDIKFIDKKENYIAIVNFSSNDKLINIKVEPINDKYSIKTLSKEYLWIGNLKANTPQWHATTDKICYLFEAIPILYKKDFVMLKPIVDNYYYNDKINFDNVYIKIYSQTYNINIKFNQDSSKKKNKKKDYRAELIKQLKEQTSNLNGFYNNVMLYTISIDGKLLVEENEYKNMLLNSISVDDLNYNDGVCSICGTKTDVTSDTKKLFFKYYNTDKHSFASNIQDFSKSFQICKNCYSSLISGENYIKKNLTSYIGYTILIIPEETPFVQKNIDIEEAFKLVNSAINNNINSIIDLQNNKLSINGPDEYFINIIFYVSSNSSFKIIDIITEIPISRIKEIDSALGYTIRNFSNLLQSSKYFNIDDFRRMLAIYKKESLSMIKRIFTGTPIKKTELIKRFNEYNASQFFNKDKSKFVYNNIIKQNAYIKFLQKAKSIKEEINMESKEFEEKMGYNSVEEALFNMGFAIGEIGKHLYASKEIDKNPLLGKINFQGMNFRSVFRLGNSIDEKIEQYDIYSKKLSNSLKIFHEILSKYIVNKDKWPLTDDENVFLIMTGYSISRNNKNEEEEVE